MASSACQNPSITWTPPVPARRIARARRPLVLLAEAVGIFAEAVGIFLRGGEGTMRRRRKR